MRIKTIGVLSVMCASLAHASLTIPNASYLGINKYISIPTGQAGTSNGYNLGLPVGPGGGEFLTTLSNTGSSSASNILVGAWCVDDQLFVDPANPIATTHTNVGNVISMNDLAATPGLSTVRYSNVTNGGSPGWTNTVANASALPTSALARYEMAAYLVSQYTGFSATISGSAARENAIQQAIWAITNNSTPTQQQAGHSAISAIGGVTTTGYWVNQALLNYSSVDTRQWAIISWGAAVDGTLNTGGYLTASPALQTFLVLTTIPVPEPGFYGAMALGLTGLFMVMSRRKKA